MNQKILSLALFVLLMGIISTTASAWYNGYDFRYNTTTTSDISMTMPCPLNGSYGIDLNGNIQTVWAGCKANSTNELLFYYDNENSYAVTDETDTLVNFCVENGGGTSNNCSGLWDNVTGLVALYSLNGTAYDSTSNGYDGSASGVTWGDSYGLFGQGGSFNDDYIDLNENDVHTDQTGNSNYSVSLWFNCPLDQSTSTRLYAVRDIGGTPSLGMIQIRDGYKPTGYIRDSDSVTLQPIIDVDYCDAEWHHIALVKEAGTLRLYVDGGNNSAGDDHTLATTFTGNFDTIDDAEIGNDPSNHGIGFEGYIDQVMIFNKALTENEVIFLSQMDILNTLGSNETSPTPDYFPSVSLNTPIDGSTSTSATVNFTYTPIDDYGFQEARLYYKPDEEIKIAIFSEFSLNPDHANGYYGNVSERLEKAIGHADSWGADVVVATGEYYALLDKSNCTDDGIAVAKERFYNISNILKNSTAEYVNITLGNHDLHQFNKTFINSYFHQTANYSYYDYKGYRLIFLDTMANQTTRRCGSDYVSLLGTTQLTWLQEIVTNSNLPAIIFMHHVGSNWTSYDSRFYIDDRYQFQSIIESPDSTVIAVIEGNMHGIYNDTSSNLIYISPGEFHGGYDPVPDQCDNGYQGDICGASMWLQLTIFPRNNTLQFTHIIPDYVENITGSYDFSGHVNSTWDWGIKETNSTPITNNSINWITEDMQYLVNKINYTWAIEIVDSDGKSKFSDNRTLYFDLAPSPETTPLCTLYSPTNTTYTSIPIDLNVSANDTIDTWYYDLNGTGNQSFSPNTTVSVAEGLNHIIIWCNNSDDNWDTDDIWFTYTPPLPQAIEITIASPTNTTYSNNTIALNVSANDTIDTWYYDLNGTGNVTFSPNITLVVAEGLNHIVVWANNSADEWGTAEVYFTYTEPTPSITGRTIDLLPAPFNVLGALILSAGWILLTINLFTRKKLDHNMLISYALISVITMVVLGILL